MELKNEIQNVDIYEKMTKAAKAGDIDTILVKSKKRLGNTFLQYKREVKKLTQKELAEKSGVNIRMIQFYEQRVRDINKAQASTLLKLAKTLECSIEDILELENIEYVSKAIGDIAK